MAIFMVEMLGLKLMPNKIFSKYLDVLFQAPEFDLDVINGEDLMYVCTHGNYTSGGLDGWSPRDWSVLPLVAFNMLALLLNTIEKGHPWTSGVLHGKAALLTKDASKPAVAVDDFRALLMLALLNRKWAAVRLYRLTPWIVSWALEGMFAGVPGQAAEDAWWVMSLVMETALSAGLWVSGGAQSTSTSASTNFLVSLWPEFSAQPEC